jgi:hypothetical protein
MLLNEIDKKILLLLQYRDSEYVLQHADVRGSICNVISHCYSLETCILLSDRKLNSYSNDFFVAKSAVNRHVRDSGLDEVADIYNELCEIAKPYMEQPDRRFHGRREITARISRFIKAFNINIDRNQKS